MILVREVFQAKYGRGGELVAVLKQGQHILTAAGYPRERILTDASALLHRGHRG